MMNERPGFFSSLFDLSFSEFITTRIIKLLFVLLIIMSGIMALGMIVSGFASKSGAIGILALLLSPVVFLIYVVMARVWLELVIVAFRIAENTSRLVKMQEGKGEAAQEAGPFQPGGSTE